MCAVMQELRVSCFTNQCASTYVCPPLHSYEGNALEDPWDAPSEDMFTRSVSPEQVCAVVCGRSCV